jgi:hypothetical protein
MFNTSLLVGPQTSAPSAERGSSAHFSVIILEPEAQARIYPSLAVASRWQDFSPLNPRTKEAAP